MNHFAVLVSPIIRVSVYFLRLVSKKNFRMNTSLRLYTNFRFVFDLFLIKTFAVHLSLNNTCPLHFLPRQERLEQLAEKFERKAALRESWVNDMIKVLSDQNFGNNTSQVEAALKKQEAISSDVEARVSTVWLCVC